METGVMLLQPETALSGALGEGGPAQPSPAPGHLASRMSEQTSLGALSQWPQQPVYLAPGLSWMTSV